MRQSLVNGTATTLILVAATLPIYAEKAYAGSSSAFDPTAMLYGATPPSSPPPTAIEELAEESAVVALGAAGAVGGAGLLAAGVALARHWHEGDPDEGAEADSLRTSEQVDGSGTDDAWQEARR